ncbi:hypothetical protein WJX81_000011 [Elliptochloris bilobata]|uniref:Uncharacterized protein n=1 Tax=Elliptochloris bilobata TaxID=381761 RepID=A0AAW1S4B9_9CHLO
MLEDGELFPVDDAAVDEPEATGFSEDDYVRDATGDDGHLSEVTPAGALGTDLSPDLAPDELAELLARAELPEEEGDGELDEEGAGFDGELDEEVDIEREAPELLEPPERRYILSDLLELAGYEPGERSNVAVTGIQTDVTQVLPGDLFVCVECDGRDGHDDAAEAVERGAAAVVAAREVADVAGGTEVLVMPDVPDAVSRLAVAFYDAPSEKMTVVGVVGSAGKSTTSWYVRGIFEDWALPGTDPPRVCVVGMAGSLENAVDVLRMDRQGDLWEPEEEDPTLDRDCSAPFHLAPYVGKPPPPAEAPDALEIQKLLAGMADRGADVAVVECASEGLDQGRLDAVDFDVLVHTNVMELSGYVDVPPLEQCAATQARLFRRLYDPQRQRAVINLDDPFAALMQEAASAVPVVTYSLYNRDADVSVERLRLNMEETQVLVRTPVGTLQINSPLVGRQNVYNILAAVATGLATTVRGQPVPLKTIVEGIEATEDVPGRMHVIDEEQPFGVIVDSASTPVALSRLLDDVRDLQFMPRMVGGRVGTKIRRIILVVGCKGDRPAALRPLMGEVAHYKADIVILTNDNPRDVPPNEIVSDTVAGYSEYILKHNAIESSAYSPGFLQDPGRTAWTSLPFYWDACYQHKRYVMEDRWMAIRWAIGTARENDCVVIAGKGQEDFQDILTGGEIARGWFDDKVEARNAVVRVAQIFDARWLDRRDLPWVEPGERKRARFTRPGIFRRTFEKQLESYPLYGPTARRSRGDSDFRDASDAGAWGAAGGGVEDGDADGDGEQARGLEGEPRDVLQAVGAGRMGPWEEEEEE